MTVLPGDRSVLLSDGRSARIRPLRDDDADAVRALYRRSSEWSRYLRFFSPVTAETAVRLTGPPADDGSQCILAAEIEGRVVGLGEYDLTQDTGIAEVAFMVEDDEQGHGLGTALLESLVQRAAARGIRRFWAAYLRENKRMPDVFAHAGFDVHWDHRDAGVGGVEFELVPTDSWSEAHAYRDDVAQARSIARLLSPTSIAVVGAGRDERSVGRAVVTNLVEGGFEGPIYPVNRHPVTIAGRPAVPTVLDIDGPVDLAVVAVSAAEVSRVAEQCAEKGVHGLVVISGGFAELDDGAARQRELVAQCRQTGMRLVGPNCVGIVNTDPDVCMNATFSPVAPVPGRVGCASQSGGVGIELLARAHALGLGVSTFVSMGNKADVSGQRPHALLDGRSGDRRRAPLPGVVRQPAHLRAGRPGAGAAQARHRAQERPQHRRCTRLPFPHRRARPTPTRPSTRFFARPESSASTPWPSCSTPRCCSPTNRSRPVDGSRW